MRHKPDDHGREISEEFILFPRRLSKIAQNTGVYKLAGVPFVS